MENKLTVRTFLIAATAGLSLLGCISASAQQAVNQSHPNDQLEELIVTAQKRESTIETTPISITALSAQDIAERGITDITSVVQSVPGVSMRTSGPGQTELEMRGMTSSGGDSSTVGFYLGDIPLTSPATAQNGKVVIDPNLYDLNRVEVLRGPQGTLYGAGSMGGTIKLVPNAPDPNAFDASAEIVLGHTDGGNNLNHSENAMVNLPLSPNIAVRLVASQQYLSGWIDRIVLAIPDFPAPISATTRGNVSTAPVAEAFHDVNDDNQRSLRASLLWNATDRFSVEPSFLYQEITQGGLSLIDSQPGTETQYQPYNASEPFEDRIDISSVNLKYHFDFADLTSTTSYWTRDANLRQDGTEEVATVLGAPIYPAEGGAGPVSPTTLEDDHSKQISEEVRLTSSGKSNFKWLMGFFYQDFQAVSSLVLDTPFTAIPGTITNGFTQSQPTKILQNSIFGEASYTFLDSFTATLGARRYYYHASSTVAVSGWLSGSGGNTTDYYSTGEKDQGATPKFSLSYQFDKGLLLYGTASEGFRPGGGNEAVPTTGALGAQCLANLQAIGYDSAPLGFKPDNVWSYELGEKFRDGQGRITVNSAGYFENWQHIQQNIPLACGYPFTGNAGNAHIYGVESEIDALLMPGLILALNGSFSHARYTANPVPGTTIDGRVQAVPDVTASASLSYRHSLTGSLGFIGLVENDYVGSRIDTTAQANYLPPYDLTNLRAGIEGQNWKVSLFVTNLTNRLALLSNAAAININVGTFNRIAVEQPLTVGVDLNYRFGSSNLSR